jgi:hypothetical protein
LTSWSRTASAVWAGETTSDNRGCGQVSPEIGITATPVIDRARNAIYVVAMSKNSSGAILYAFDATNLTNELYDSNQAANSRDHFSGNKFITPMVVNGRVYVGTPTSVAVFGLLP